MPFANLGTLRRLGVANVAFPEAYRWARQVLRLPSGGTSSPYFPVYQQQLVHRAGAKEEGPSSAAAETCATAVADLEHSLANTIREISVHETVFARRNIGAAVTVNPQYSLDTHSAL
jgi:hypothetical protein